MQRMAEPMTWGGPGGWLVVAPCPVLVLVLVLVLHPRPVPAPVTV